LYPPRRYCAVSIFPHIHGVRNARPDVSGTFIFAFAAPAVNDSELDKRCVLCYTENATNPMIARFLRGCRNAGSGQVRVNGQEWAARLVDDDVAQVGQTLKIVAIEGPKLICKK